MEDNTLEQMNNIEFEIETEEDEEVLDMAGEGGTYIKFRYTPPEITKWTREDYLKLVHWVHLKSCAKYISFGVEQLDKLGEKTHQHIHIHLYTCKKAESKDGVHEARAGQLRKAFTRSDYYKDTEIRGNKLYSCKAVLDCKDPQRFFRYVWKQKSTDVPKTHALLSAYMPMYNNGGKQKFLPDSYTPETNKFQVALAFDEWQRDVEFNRNNLEKKMNPANIDKVLGYLEAQEEPPTTPRDIMKKMLEYYTEQQMPANKNTLQGYMTIYLLRNKIVSYDDMADRFLVGY